MNLYSLKIRNITDNRDNIILVIKDLQYTVKSILLDFLPLWHELKVGNKFKPYNN